MCVCSADSWPQTPAWTGRLIISSIGDDALIELKDPANGTLFAACPIKKDGSQAVQKGIRAPNIEWGDGLLTGWLIDSC